MKIFINSMLNFAFKSAVKRDKWDAISVMVSHGMSHRKATIFIEAFSQDLEDSWQEQKRYCLIRKSTLKCYDTAVLPSFRWYDIL